MSGPVPILVFGTARSGTTRLTNLLLSREQVAGLAHPLHWGAHELPLYDYARYWGDFRRPENWARFLADLAGSDIQRLAGLDLDAWRARPVEDVNEWFLEMMDRVAETRGCRCWAAKLDPKQVSRPAQWRRLLNRLRRRYERFHVVAVRRPRADVLRSYLRMPGPAFRARKRPVAGRAARVLGLARYRVHEAALARLVADTGATVVEFADLVEDPEAVLAALEARVGELGAPTGREFPRNTSFARDGGSRPRDGAGIAAADGGRLYAVFDRAPWLATAIVRAWERRRPRSNPLYYRLRRAEDEPAELAAEFRRTGHDALIPYISGS
jgi:hypothetical protein